MLRRNRDKNRNVQPHDGILVVCSKNDMACKIASLSPVVDYMVGKLIFSAFIHPSPQVRNSVFVVLLPSTNSNRTADVELPNVIYNGKKQSQKS